MSIDGTKSTTATHVAAICTLRRMLGRVAHHAPHLIDSTYSPAFERAVNEDACICVMERMNESQVIKLADSISMALDGKPFRTVKSARLDADSRLHAEVLSLREKVGRFLGISVAHDDDSVTAVMEGEETGELVPAKIGDFMGGIAGGYSTKVFSTVAKHIGSVATPESGPKNTDTAITNDRWGTW